MALLRRTMAGYARHPNLAAALIVGLGCERNQLQELLDEEGLAPNARLHTFTMQQSGGTRKTIEAGIEAVKALLRVTSGERTKSELLGLGDHEFVPWQIGIMS
jgi:altronate hydrolase